MIGKNTTKVVPLDIVQGQIFDELNSGLRVMALKYTITSEYVHRHNFCEMVLIRGGSGVHETEFGDYSIARGDIYLVKPGEQHSYYGIKELDMINILYLPERMAIPLADLQTDPGYLAFFETSPRLAIQNHLKFTEDQTRDAEQIVEAIFKEQNSRQRGSQFAMTALFMRLVLLIARSLVPESIEKKVDFQRVGALIGYLRNHYQEMIQVGDIARHAAVSVRTLERLFRSTTGLSPGEFLSEVRLNRAAYWLQNSSLPVLEVALRSGFGDSGYFAKAFQHKFGYTPRDYRRRYKFSAGASVSDPFKTDEGSS